MSIDKDFPGVSGLVGKTINLTQTDGTEWGFVTVYEVWQYRDGSPTALVLRKKAGAHVIPWHSIVHVEVLA